MITLPKQEFTCRKFCQYTQFLDLKIDFKRST
jgi:hypothetical protein